MTNKPISWQTPLNAEAKKQLSKLFSETEFNNIFKDGKHDNNSRKIIADSKQIECTKRAI
nr:hypothetical protein 3 [Halomonadaceae bacterium]